MTTDTRTIDDKNNNSPEEEFISGDIEVSPSVIDRELVRTLLNNSLEKIKNKIEDNEDDKKDEEDSDNNDDNDDEQNFRDKDKELKESIKSQLSLDTQDVINLNDDELNQIIEKLKKRGVSRDKGIQLQKLRNITKGTRSIGL